MSRWYYAHNRQRVGPVTWEELQALAAAGQLEPSAMVLQEGDGKWRPAGQITGLKLKTRLTDADTLTTEQPAQGALQPETIDEVPRTHGTTSSFLIQAASGSNEETSRLRKLELIAVPGYAILCELGRGGMGVVYKAEQVKLKRIVALKMILAGSHANEQQIQRFLSEAEAVAKLQHPNIVQIYEIGDHEGKPFFSLEFVEGGSLDKKLAGKPLSSREAAELVETLARAIHAAHERGIVHRDLKPANVLLAKDGIPKITDFGLAKQLGSEQAQTASGAILGTPSYMAPEQADGKVKDISPATDVYALGAILYEVLTGRPPFKADSPMKTILQVVKNEPLPPRCVQPKTPRDLENICLKCLEKQPRRRYASAEALAQDLRAFLRGETVVARPVTTVERLSRWARHNPAKIGFGVLAILIMALIYALYAKPDSKQDSPASTPLPAEVMAVLDGHRGAVRSLAFTPNGSQLASASADSTTKLWDLKTSSELASFAGAEPVFCVAISPDGRTLASASGAWTSVAAGAVRLIDLETLRDKVSLQDSAAGSHSVAFSPNGAMLAAGRRDGVVTLWDTATGEVITTLRQKGTGNMVYSVGFSPDGETLASSNWNKDACVVLWSLATKASKRIIKGDHCVENLAFSPDGKLLATGPFTGNDKRNVPVHISLWETASMKEQLRLEGFTGHVPNLAFSSDGTILASVGFNAPMQRSRVALWNTTTGRMLKEWHGGFWSVAISPDGKRLASGENSGRILIYDLSFLLRQ